LNTKAITGTPHLPEEATYRGRPTVDTSPPEGRIRSAVRRRSFAAHVDPGLTVVAADPDFCRLFGRTSAEVCGRSLHELLRAGAPAVLRERLARLLAGGRSHVTDRVVGRDGAGGALPGELTAIAVRSASGRVTGLVILFRPDDRPSGPAPEGTAARDAGLTLTRINAQVLEGVALGASTAQLAARLHLSRQGVEYHVGLLLRKFRAPNRAALVARANAAGVLPAGQWPPRVPQEFIK
jgi:PAS domain S-box-containing protein